MISLKTYEISLIIGKESFNVRTYSIVSHSILKQ